MSKTLRDDVGLQETTVSSQTVYQGHFLHVLQDTVALPNGAEATREYIKHPGATMVIPVFDNGDVLVIRQYRHPLNRVFIEFPAGKKDAGESSLLTGQRELLEETGYVATDWQHVTDIHNAIAYSDEVIHFYMARGLTQQSTQHLDEGEFLDLMRVSFDDLLQWMHDGLVPDVKTQLGIFWLKDVLQKSKTT